MPVITGRTLEEMLLLSGEVAPTSKHTDGTFPRRFWVTKGGDDGDGNGSFSNPFLTWRRAIRQAVDNRGDWIFVGPGIWRETPDIGAGDTTSGPSGGYQKRGLHIIGTGSGHTGLTQLVSDGTTDQPTLRVQDGYLSGFTLKHIELDAVDSSDATRARPILELETSDTGTLTATSADYHFLIEDVHILSDGTPTAGFLFTGATKGTVRNCSIGGVTHGIFFRGSTNNNPSDITFEDIDFLDNVTADISCGVLSYITAPSIEALTTLTNIKFLRPRFWDRGGTPVTNYVNLLVTTAVNVHLFEFVAARDVADDTLMALPVDVVAIGRSAAAAEFIIGA